MDKLFLLNPNFADSNVDSDNQMYYCPFNALVEGVLAYYPHLRDKLDITYIEFPRPRQPIIDLIGEANQGTPVLIIDTTEIDTSSIKTNTYQETTFINDANEIVKYFALVFNIGLPHP